VLIQVSNSRLPAGFSGTRWISEATEPQVSARAGTRQHQRKGTLYTDEFGTWYETLEDDQQDAVIARVELLETEGPWLGRPTVDTIVGARHPNMKELRVSKGGAIRILFDPRRQAAC
jgi:hypothetical protein